MSNGEKILIIPGKIVTADSKNFRITSYNVCYTKLLRNDEGALGATRALEQANLDKKAVVVGIGGYLAIDEYKKDYSAFMATAYIDPVLDGQIAATRNNFV